MSKYTTKSIVIALIATFGFGLFCGLARIHLGWFSNMSQMSFSIMLGVIVGGLMPFILKPKD